MKKILITLFCIAIPHFTFAGYSASEDGGVEAVESNCSTCHSLMIVQAQRLSRARWDRLLKWMVEEQGMPELDAEERTVILDYLSQNYGPSTPH